MDNFLMWAGSILFGAVSAMIGWIFKMIFKTLSDQSNDHEHLARSLSNHKLHAAETFATKKEVENGLDRIMKKLDKIDDKLDLKVDK